MDATQNATEARDRNREYDDTLPCGDFKGHTFNTGSKSDAG
jgi:hypothetical protein